MSYTGTQYKAIRRQARKHFSFGFIPLIWWFTEESHRRHLVELWIQTQLLNAEILQDVSQVYVGRHSITLTGRHATGLIYKIHEALNLMNHDKR